MGTVADVGQRQLSFTHATHTDDADNPFTTRVESGQKKVFHLFQFGSSPNKSIWRNPRGLTEVYTPRP